MALLPNPSFENAIVPVLPFLPRWRPVNLAGSVQCTRIQSPIAKSGKYFLSVRTAQAGGSVAIDIPTPSVAAPSILALAWVRSAPNQSTVSGALTIWNLTPNTATQALFNTTQDWQLVTATVDRGGEGPNGWRIEFYVNTPNVDLMIDSVNAF